VFDGYPRAGRGEQADARLPERQPGSRRAQVGRDPQRTAPHQQPPGLFVEVGPHPFQPRIGQLGPGPAQRDKLPVPGVDAEVRLAVALRPVEFGPQEGRLVLRVGDLGRPPAVPGELGLAAVGDRRREPGLDVVGEVLPRGVGPPLLAHEQHRRVRPGQHQACRDLDQLGRQRGGDPVAGRPVADLIVILQVAEEAVGGHPEHVDVPPMAPAAEGGPAAVVEEHPGVGLRQRRKRSEVAVVALPFAGDGRVHCVVEVVTPLRGEPVAARLAGGDQLGIVGVGLGDQHELAVQPGRQGLHLGRELFEDVQRPAVLDRVHRVQPQPVEVIVAQPHQCVADDERAHLVRARLVQVDRGTPRRHVRVGEVRPERVEPVADTDVVVHDVKQDGQAAGVAGVHEPLEPVRPAVRLVHRPQVDPVVAPAVATGERRHRHQLDRVHAQVTQVIQPPDGVVERALRGERAEMQLVDHRSVQRPAPPARVRPAECGVVIGAAQPLDAERLPQRPGVWQHLAVIEPEAVVDAAGHVRHVRAPPAGAAPGRLLVHRIAPPGDLDLDLTGRRGPHAERPHQALPPAGRSCSCR
jgi:hypothetical protein